MDLPVLAFWVREFALSDDEIYPSCEDRENDPKDGNSERPSPCEDAMTTVAPCSRIRNRTGKMTQVSWLVATLTNAAKALRDALLAEMVRVFLPESAVTSALV